MQAYVPYLHFFDHAPVAAGDFIYVSSDLRKLAYQAKKHREQFDPQLFLKALKQKITPEGTIIIPAFNYTLKHRDTFNIRHTPPITGTLPVEALKDEDFKRTPNPMHSFAVWGKWQQQIMALPNISSFGADSPFAMMQQSGCRLLGIDVDLQQSLTFAHYAEEMAAVSYRKHRTYEVSYTAADGSTSQAQFSIYAKKPGYVNQVNPLLPLFRQAGIIREFSVNQVPCFVLDLRASYELMMHDLLQQQARHMTYFSWQVWMRSLAKSILRK